MKKAPLFLTIVLSSTLFFNAWAQADSGVKGELIFSKHANECLLVMDQAARDMEVKGVALVAFIPGDTTTSWTSEMIVVGALRNSSASFLAIAYSKAAEMADTYKDSGSGSREVLHGEFGYQGGVIKKVGSAYILAVFSGASGEQDVEIAQAGVDCLYEQF